MSKIGAISPISSVTAVGVSVSAYTPFQTRLEKENPPRQGPKKAKKKRPEVPAKAEGKYLQKYLSTGKGGELQNVRGSALNRKA